MSGDSTTPASLVEPGTSIGFYASGRGTCHLGQVIKIVGPRLHALLGDSTSSPVRAPVDGGLVVPTEAGQGVVVAAHARPVDTLTSIEPRTGLPPDRRIDPRVPVHSMVKLSCTIGAQRRVTHGQMSDISIGGCQLSIPGQLSIAISPGAQVEIETRLSGVRLGFRAAIVAIERRDDDATIRVRFVDLDAATQAATAAFVEQRLARLRTADEPADSIPAHLATPQGLKTVRYFPDTGTVDAELPAAQRVRLSFRLPGVAPVLHATGLTRVAESAGTHIDWTQIDPVTKVLVQGARDAHLAQSVIDARDPTVWDDLGPGFQALGDQLGFRT